MAGMADADAGPVPTLRLLVVGEGPVSDTLGAVAAAAGWHADVVGTLPEAQEALPAADAVVVTSHDDDVDAPAIRAALGSSAQYVAAMGSRSRQARRREWLVANGLTDADLAPLHAPAGLDIGADSPGEIAVAILAELVGVLRGRSPVGSLKDRSGPIHPDQAPGERYSPPS